MFSNQTILVTGGAGFIGSAFCRYINHNTKNKIIILDKMTYASNSNSIKNIIKNDNVILIKGSIGNKTLVEKLLKDYHPNYVINFAAETHVDNSIKNPESFIKTNIVDTHNFLGTLLEYYKQLNDLSLFNFKFLQVSTDEVYGDIAFDAIPVNENAQYKPSSPYSASKAAGDHLVKAYFRTFNFPGLISNCSNNFGPYQHHEKFIPKIINNILNDIKIPIYGDGSQIREWIYVDDHCEALKRLIINGNPGENYNIGSGNEISNLELVRSILLVLKSFSLVNKTDVISYVKFIDDRLGHDKRYSIDSSKIKSLCDWNISTSFDNGLKKTISSIVNVNNNL